MARLQYRIKNTLLSTLIGGGSSATIDYPTTQIVGTPTARIWKDGTSAPAFTNMVDVGATYQHKITGVHSSGLYNFEYKDGARQVVLGQLYLFDQGDSCPTSLEFISSVNFLQLFVSVQDVTYAADPHILKVSIDGGVTYKSLSMDAGSNSGSTLIYNADITLAGLTNNIPTILLNRARSCSPAELGTNFFIGSASFPPMVVGYSVTGVSVDGGSDGTIVLNITGGSGNRTYLWGDGPTTQNRNGLAEGVYTVLITDVITHETANLTITVTDPGPTTNPGTLLTISAINPITFVVDPDDVNECDNPQALDNVLFCQQVYEGFEPTNYFQRLMICDKVPNQFNSDYPQFEISLRKYFNGEVVKLIDYELKEQNLGLVDDYAITIRDHTGVNQSRVYFNVGDIPIPLQPGDSIQILNNAEGYNGLFSILEILNDDVLGYQYLVINKNFIGPGLTQSATGRFESSTVDFNVFEFILDCNDVTEGKYFIKIVASDGLTTKTAISEPISIAATQPGTNLLKYSNSDNAFDITWSTGMVGLMRVPSTFGHKRTPGGERTTTRNANFSLVKVNAKKTRIVPLQTWSLSPYMHEKLSVIFDLDNWSINNVPCQASDAYDEPEYKDRSLLSNSSIKVEAQWFNKYNSDDIGTVADGGFITTETGFLKR